MDYVSFISGRGQPNALSSAAISALWTCLQAGEQVVTCRHFANFSREKHSQIPDIPTSSNTIVPALSRVYGVRVTRKARPPIGQPRRGVALQRSGGRPTAERRSASPVQPASLRACPAGHRPAPAPSRGLPAHVGWRAPHCSVMCVVAVGFLARNQRIMCRSSILQDPN
ncbi:Protein of unknown function [Gryllus bimaculatus]|nr:Protein of unknown function [Gryllus bimaculatus]